MDYMDLIKILSSNIGDDTSADELLANVRQICENMGFDSTLFNMDNTQEKARKVTASKMETFLNESTNE